MSVLISMSTLEPMAKAEKIARTILDQGKTRSDI